MSLRMTDRTYQTWTFIFLALSQSAIAAAAELNPEFTRHMEQSGGVTIS